MAPSPFRQPTKSAATVIAARPVLPLPRQRRRVKENLWDRKGNNKSRLSKLGKRDRRLMISMRKLDLQRMKLVRLEKLMGIY